MGFGMIKKMTLYTTVLALFAGVAAGATAPAVLSAEMKALPIGGEELLHASVVSTYDPLVLKPWEDVKHEFGSRKYVPVIEATKIIIDGDLDEWEHYSGLSLPQQPEQIVIEGWAGEEDLSAHVYFAYDDDFFYWSARVTDNNHTPVADSTMWRGDSIQFAFGLDGQYGPEYGINFLDGEAQLWRFSDGKAVAGIEQMTAAASQDGKDIVYEVKMPWTVISTGMPEDGIVPFTLLFNDNDGGGRRGWIEWTPGIGKAKNPNEHARLLLTPTDQSWSFWIEGPTNVQTSEPAEYTMHAVNWRDAATTLELVSEALEIQQSFELPPKFFGELTVPFTTVAPGAFLLDFVVTEPATGQTQQQQVAVEASMRAETIEAKFNALQAKLPQLEHLLLETEAEGLSTDYERINFTVIKDFIGYGKEDLLNGRQSRAEYVVIELERLYDEAETKLQSYLNASSVPQAAPRYQTGRSEIFGYSFIGDTKVRSTGVTEQRPIFYTGYGHFEQVRADIPKFQNLGTNIIQIELGPRDVIYAKEDVAAFNVYKSGAVNATAQVVNEAAHSGNYSLRIDNSSPRQANVFINTRQTLKVEPNTTYTFKAWVKGENAKNVWFPGGAGWSQRQPFPNGTYDWTEVTHTYSTGPAETSFDLTILSENTGTVWIDDLTVTKSDSMVNLVQNPGFEEVGDYPDKEYKISTQKIDNDIVKVLQRAETNDIAVNLLISPHYFPTWALVKWPELNVSNNGSIKFSIFHPKAKNIIEDYLRVLIPRVKDYESLHSITISNEPTYQSFFDDYAQEGWHHYLEEVYDGDIQALNDVYGSAYSAFTEIAMPTHITASPLSYDYVMFNQDYFARWHQWMADTIHELAPELPIHAKIMGDPNGSLAWGIDIERFSEMSQINGNDNWNYVNEGPKGFMEELSFYDMQASFKQAPIFNSEQHIIADGDKWYAPIQAMHTRSVLWQSAIHGRSASTIWIWERSYNEASTREGSILHRPDVVAEVGRTNLDLNRLALEVTALQNEVSQAAILHSVSSGVYSKVYSNAMLRAYEALSYSGRKVGFVSERQIAGGGLSDFKLLIVPDATHVDADTLSGIRQFMEQGGRVLVIGSDALKYDSHMLPLSADDRNEVMSHADTIAAQDWTAEQIRTRLAPILDTIDPDRLMLTDAATGQIVSGVEWRSVERDDGSTLLNIVNYGTTAVAVTATGGSYSLAGATNLITGEQISTEPLELTPLTPYLLELPAAIDPVDPVDPVDPNEPGYPGGSTVGQNGVGSNSGQKPNANVQTIVPADIKSNQQVVALKEGEDSVLLLFETLKKIVDKQTQLVILQGNVRLTLTVEAVRSLINKKRADEASLQIRINAVEEQEEREIAKQTGRTTNADVAVIGQMWHIAAQWVSEDEHQSVSAFPNGLSVSFPLDERSSEEVIGIYEWSKEGQLLYRGGKAIDGHMETVIPHPGSYAVFSYMIKFADVPQSHWASEAIRQLAGRQVVTGMTPTSFKPEQAVSRAEFIAMLNRAIGIGDAVENPFRDVRPGTWYAGLIAGAAKAGLIQGDSRGRFLPEETLSREQMAALLVRAYGWMQGNKPGAASFNHATMVFSDYAQIAAWAASDVQSAIQLQLMKGRSVDAFVPKGKVSRAESAQAIYNLLQVLQDKE